MNDEAENDDEYAQQVEATIRRLIEYRNVAREGSAEHCMIERQLEGVRNESELAGMIYEDLTWY